MDASLKTRKLVEGFQHLPGHHCGSTALRDLCHLYGHELSEAMCFGLASGIGFFYIQNPPFKGSRLPARLFGGRTKTLEVDFFRNLGLPFAWEEGDTFPWPAMQAWLDRDVPVLLMCDLKYLPYYKTRTHFSGHVVVLVGYDQDDVLLADTHFEGLQRASRAELARAMASDHFPIPVKNHWRAIERFDLPDLRLAGRRAILRAAQNMLEPHHAHAGVAGLYAFRDDLPSWAALENLSWTARFAYQVIERRGTGGAHFRRLYADFLEEMAERWPVLKTNAILFRSGTIADHWTVLAGIFKELSETEDHTLLKPAADLVQTIAEEEQALFRDLQTLLG